MITVSYIFQKRKRDNRRCMEIDLTDELTAYHEAGHAFMAVVLGGRAPRVTLEPEWDEGQPARFGDTAVEFPHESNSQRDIYEKSIMVALAGPVAESLYRGEPLHPAFVSEWAEDWQTAWRIAESLISNEQKRLLFLEKTVVEIRGAVDAEYAWAAVSAIADHLLAFDTIEGEEVESLVRQWIR